MLSSPLIYYNHPTGSAARRGRRKEGGRRREQGAGDGAERENGGRGEDGERKKGKEGEGKGERGIAMVSSYQIVIDYL